MVSTESYTTDLPQNGFESLVVKYSGPRSFDCDAENPIVTQFESKHIQYITMYWCII